MSSNRSSHRPLWLPALLLLLCGACNTTHSPDAGAYTNASAGSGGPATPAAGHQASEAASSGSAAGTGNRGSAGQVAATGGAAAGTAGSASTAGNPAVRPECIVPLSDSGCAATYDAEVSSIDCSKAHYSQTSLYACGERRAVSIFVVDVGTTCSYDRTGKLVSTATCSKPIGNCNCFVSGDLTPVTCDKSQPVDACAEDAGTP